MKILRWLKSRTSPERRANWLYRRGMLNAKLKQHQKAINDYSTVIETDGISPSLKSMALFNRALVYHAKNREREAGEDLNRLLSLSGAPGDVKTEARRKLLRMKKAADRSSS